VEALTVAILDGPVHPLDLSVGPRMVRFGEPVLATIASSASDKVAE